MKEIRKNQIKTTGSIVGAIGGACASHYATAVLSAICPPAGIAAKIGSCVIGGVITGICAKYIEGAVNEAVDCIDAFSSVVEEVKNTNSNEEVEKMA